MNPHRAVTALALASALLAAGPASSATYDSNDVTLAGRWASGPCYSVAGAGNLVYIGDGAMVRILDVSTPSAPVELGSVTVKGFVRGLALSGNRLCVASHYDGLRVLDVSNPAAPFEAGSVSTGAETVAVSAQGDYAYVGTSGDGLRIVNISTPSAPAVIATVPLGYIWATAVNGNLAFAGGYTEDLYVIDVTVPGSPSVLADIDVHGICYGIEAAGDYVYTAATGTNIAQLTIVDVSTPALPVEADRYSVTFTTGSGLGLDGSTVYFAAGLAGGMRILDVSNPADVVLLGQIDTPGWASDVTVLGSHAFVADRNRGLRAVDVSTPSAPAEVGFFETAGKTFDVAVSGSIAYLGDREEGLRVLDIGNPASPVEIGSLATVGIPSGLTVQGDIVYISNDTNGLVVVDVSTPSSPALLATYDVGAGGAAWECVVSGTLAYVAAQSKGLHIVDVSTPSAPVQVGSIVPPQTFAIGVDVRYPYAYVAAGFAGLYVIDVSDPSAPSVLGFLDTTNARDVEIDASGDYAIVADGQNGVIAIDVTDPANPFLVSTVALDYGRELEIEGATAYVVTEDSGLRVIDLSALPALSETGYYDTADEAFGLDVDGARVFVADDDDGLWILESLAAVSVESAQLPGPSALQRSWPNPFRVETNVRFALPRSAPVRLSVHDARGRRVATLFEGSRTAGPHEVAWNGRDAQGRRVGSGVYWIRLETEGRSESTKVTVLR